MKINIAFSEQEKYKAALISNLLKKRFPALKIKSTSGALYNHLYLAMDEGAHVISCPEDSIMLKCKYR